MMLRKFYVQATGGVTVGHGVQHLGTGQVVFFFNERAWNVLQVHDNLRTFREMVTTTALPGEAVAQILWNDDNSHPAGKGLARDSAAA